MKTKTIAFAVVLIFLGYIVGNFVEGENTRLAANYHLLDTSPLFVKDRVTSRDFAVFNDKLVLNKQGLKYGKIENTHSMEPLLTKNSNSIEMDVDAKDLVVGDVISYKNSDGRNIIHRIVEIGSDREGWFAITKGDNNGVADSEKVRADSLIGVLVGILY